MEVRRLLVRCAISAAAASAASFLISYLRERAREHAGGRAQRMSGKIAIVTGATSGIGRLLAFRLVSKGIRVVLPCRAGSMSAGAALVRRLQELAPEGTEEAVAEHVLCDLADLKSVRTFAEDFRAKNSKLDLLVLNAAMCPATNQTEVVLTRDGYEEAFQTNHLAHHLMTRLLEQTLLASAPARVVVVSSGLHLARATDKLKPDLKIETLELLRADWAVRPNGMLLYKNSKLANTAFAFELHARLQKQTGKGGAVTVNAVSPGFIPNTGLSRWQGPQGRFFMRYIMPWLPFSFISKIEDGADALEYACLSPELEGAGGKYLAKGVETPSPQASDPAFRAALWKLSETAVAPFL